MTASPLAPTRAGMAKQPRYDPVKQAQEYAFIKALADNIAYLRTVQEQARKQGK